MALRLDASGDSLSRTASLPSIQSFTICGVSVINSDLGNAAQGVTTWGPEVLAYLLWEYGFGESRMAVGSWDGGTEAVTLFTNKPAVGVRFFWYLRCSGSGSNLLQAGWMPFGDTAFTEQRTTTIRPGTGTAIYLGNSSYGEHSNADFGAVKVWNVALSDAELLAEAPSERAVKTSGLLIDSPMTGANVTAAAADLSGNGYNWTVGGTLTVVSGPVYGTTHSLTASAFSTGGPAFASPALGQTHALGSLAFATTSPAYTAPAIAQTHLLTQLNLSIGSPALDTAPLVQTHALASSPLTTSSPVLGSPALASITPDILTADNLTLSAVVFSAPVLGQLHTLAAPGFAPGSIFFGSPFLSTGSAPTSAAPHTHRLSLELSL